MRKRHGQPRKDRESNRYVNKLAWIDGRYRDALRPSTRETRAQARAIAERSIERKMPDRAKLDLLSWDELTVKAARAQKHVAQEVHKRVLQAGLPLEDAEWAAKVAAAKLGEPYHRNRERRFIRDPTHGGLYLPPEERERDLRAAAALQARAREGRAAAMQRAAETKARQVRRRPRGDIEPRTAP